MASAAFSVGTVLALADGDGMDYETSDKYLVRFEIGGPDYGKVGIPAPGVPGQGSKEFGYKEQMILLHCTYVQDSENDCVSEFNGDMHNLANNAPSTLVLAGENFYGATLIPGRSGFKQPKQTGLANAKVFCDGTLAIKCWRLS